MSHSFWSVVEHFPICHSHLRNSFCLLSGSDGVSVATDTVASFDQEFSIAFNGRIQSMSLSKCLSGFQDMCNSTICRDWPGSVHFSISSLIFPQWNCPPVTWFVIVLVICYALLDWYMQRCLGVIDITTKNPISNWFEVTKSTVQKQNESVRPLLQELVKKFKMKWKPYRQLFHLPSNREQ